MRRYRALFSILLLIVFIDWMSVGLVYPMFSSISFHQDMGVFPSDATEASRGIWLGALLSACPLAQFFSAPVVGILSDRKGRSLVLKMTLGIATTGYFISAISLSMGSLFFLLIGQLITGIGTGNISVVNAAVADLSLPHEKTKNFGLISMANGIGFAIGPFLGGQLSTWGTLTTPFLFAGSISLLNFFLLILVFRETIHVKKKEPFSLFSSLFDVKKIAQFSAIYTLIFSLFIFCVGWSFYWEFISVTWIKRYDLSTAEISHLYGYGAGWFALSSGLLIRPILQRFSGIKILSSALLALGCSILPLLWQIRVELFWIFIPIQQYLLAFLFPIGVSIISNEVPENKQGEMMGILQSIESLAFALTPLFAGAFVAIDYNMPIVVGSLSMLLASFVLFLGQGLSMKRAPQK